MAIKAKILPVGGSLAPVVESSAATVAIGLGVAVYMFDRDFS